MLGKLTRAKGMLLTAVALQGCASVSSTRPMLAASAYAMPDETAYTLYDEPIVRLVDLPAEADRAAFWDDFTAQASAFEELRGPISVTLLASGRVLRTRRTIDGIPIAIHFAIFEQRQSSGQSVIRLVALGAWKPSFGGNPVPSPMVAADAHQPLKDLAADLVVIANRAK